MNNMTENLNLIKVQQEYELGSITKKQAVSKVADVIRSLLDIQEMQRSGSIINKVEIRKDGIVFWINNKGIRSGIILENDGYYSIAATILATGTIESDIGDEIDKLIKDGDTILDIGSNIGWYSVDIASHFKNAKVYAFEPVTHTYDYLVKNIKLNKLKNVFPYNLGLSDENGETVFYFNSKSTQSSSMRDLQYVENSVSEKVVCMLKKMDEFCNEKDIKKIDFIKCDVEGAELLVYKGGSEIISRSRPLIVSEMLRKWSAKFGYHPNDIILFFKSMNYRCIALGKHGVRYYIDMVTEDTVETNYLFVPMERIDEVVEIIGGVRVSC